MVKTALTGAVVVLNDRMGGQQRPAQVTGGLLGRLRPGRAADQANVSEWFCGASVPHNRPTSRSRDEPGTRVDCPTGGGVQGPVG
jgi:hypothetical protein